MKQNYTKLLSTGSALPKNAVPNSYFESILDTTDEWIQSRSGIKQRYFADENESVLDITEAAAKDAIKKAGIDASEIGLIIVATDTPEKLLPSTASLLQGRLGIHRAAVFDMQCACAGFVYALGVSDSMQKNMNIKYSLIIGAAQYSKVIDFKDRTTSFLFGDGVGCALMALSDEPGVIDTRLSCDGLHAPMLEVPWGISQGYDAITDDNKYIKMDGKSIYKLSVKLISQEVKQFLADNNTKVEDIDWFVPHQANIRIIQGMAEKIGIPLEKCISTLDKHANTSAASIPLALNDALENGTIKKGDTILMEGFGAGFTWGSALIKL